MNKNEIKLSKVKILTFLTIAVLFVVIGGTSIYTSTNFMDQLVWGTVVVLFGAAAIVEIKNLLDKTDGFIVDEKGITDNANSKSVGVIEWSDISEIKTAHARSRNFIYVSVNNPDTYLNRVSGLKRLMMKHDVKKSGSLIAINGALLKCNFNDLERLLNDGLAEYRAKA